MPVSTSVKYFHSAMSGAPVLNGTAGSLIAVLDACLVAGFNLKAVDTLTVASGVATATIGTGIGAFEADAVVLIAGATPSGLNGEKRIISTTANTITFDATGIADQTATGTITAKLASAGWEKQFTGTHLAAYRSLDPSSTQAALRVDDSVGGRNARVVGYESMSDVDTGTGPFPTSAQANGGLWWPKANDTSSTPRGWTVIADSKTVYVHMFAATTVVLGGYVAHFGDFASYKIGDAYAALLTGATSDISGAGVTIADLSHPASTPNYVARAFTGLGSSLSASSAVESYNPATYSGNGNAATVPAYPNGADNSLVLTRKIIFEPSSLRGVMRGLLFSVQDSQVSNFWRDKISGSGTNAGRKIMAVRAGGPVYSGSPGVVLFFDITGPW